MRIGIKWGKVKEYNCGKRLTKVGGVVILGGGGVYGVYIHMGYKIEVICIYLGFYRQ